MPLTQEQLANRIASDLAHKILQALTWEDYVDFAASELTTQEKERVVEAAKKGNNGVAGSLLNQAVGRRIRNDAKVEADAMVLDNTLNGVELNRWLGDG